MPGPKKTKTNPPPTTQNKAGSWIGSLVRFVVNRDSHHDPKRGGSASPAAEAIVLPIHDVTTTAALPPATSTDPATTAALPPATSTEAQATTSESPSSTLFVVLSCVCCCSFVLVASSASPF